MRKTILTFAIVSLTVVTGSFAARKTQSAQAVEITNIFDAEINSFCKAIVQGDINTVKRLIDLGEDVNQKSLGKTPAIFAARHNRVEILELLIANGADLNIRCIRGWTITKHAELSGAKEVMAVIEANT